MDKNFESSIHFNNIKQNMKLNKTFEIFMNICYQYDISIFYSDGTTYHLKPNDELLNECKKKKEAVYQSSINKLSTLMKSDMEWIDSKTRIDKISDDLKNNIKKIDLLIYLLKNVYDEKSLSNMTKTKTNNVKKYVFIEQYSN